MPPVRAAPRWRFRARLWSAQPRSGAPEAAATGEGVSLVLSGECPSVFQSLGTAHRARIHQETGRQDADTMPRTLIVSSIAFQGPLIAACTMRTDIGAYLPMRARSVNAVSKARCSPVHVAGNHRAGSSGKVRCCARPE